MDFKNCRRRHHVQGPAKCIPGCQLDYEPIWCDPGMCNATHCQRMVSMPTYLIQRESTTKPGTMLHSDCAWKPSSIKWMLTLQKQRHGGYNEVVYDTDMSWWADALPTAIEAFFVPEDAPEDAKERARTAHAAFLQEYQVSADDVPLLMWAFSGDPFRSLHV